MQNEASTAASKVKGIPDNSSIIIPRLVCRDPAGEIDFCEAVFEAKVLNRRPGPNGSVAHGLLTIREEMVMIEAEWPQLPSKAPQADGSSPVMIFVYVPDVDQTIGVAIEYGAKILVAAQNQFWGDRSASPAESSRRLRKSEQIAGPRSSTISAKARSSVGKSRLNLTARSG